MKRSALRLAIAAALVAVVPALVSGCGRRKPARASAPVAAASSSAALADEDDPSAAPIAEIDLSRGAPETRGGGLLHSERATYFELVEAIERLHQDDDVHGVFVRFGSTRIGWSRVEEVARGLHQLREEGKTIYCHADDLGNGTYWLAAEGCDRIWISPAGSVATVGISAELMFAHDLLTKVGVDADILQIGKFKGANETMMRSSASEESRQSIGGVLTDLRARWLSGVQTGRGRHDLVRGLEAGPHAPGEARASGLIDDVGYEIDARRALRDKVGRGHNDNVFGGAGAHRSGGGGVIELVRTLTGARRKGKAGGSSHVAVLRASGAITMEHGGGLGGQDGIDARTMTKQLRALARDDSARAVVLRIDSPGGSALASDIIWHELMELRKKKPIIVSVGDMAASGGYYLACAGTKIVAEESSIVGSIGVVGGKLAFGRALRDIGVNTESISADPAASGKPPYLSPFSPWDDATRVRVRATMQDVYDLFVRRVAEGRGVGVDKVQTFAEGRIWSGREGRALGMVDTWGGLADAVDLARKEAKLDPGVDVRLVGRDHDFFDVFGLDDDDAAALSPRPDGLLGVLAASPDAEPLLAFGGSIAPLATGERALVAMPFAFLVRLRRPGGGGAPPYPGRRMSEPNSNEASERVDAERRRVTLPPPEWGREAPMSVTDAGLVASLRTPAVPRVSGPRADFAWQTARLRDAREAKDTISERQAAIALARFLAARGMDFDAVVKLSRRALALGDDPSLRTELAGWLTALGDHALAAADWAHLASAHLPAQASRERTRAGELLARAGQAATAAEHLRRAAENDPESPLPLEILGSLAIWAPNEVRIEVSVAAFLEAADRRSRQRDAEGAFEDRLRAFDLCPTHEGAVESVYAALSSRGRGGGADDVLRRHALALGAAGAPVHVRRLRDALVASDVPRALFAALDARLDATLEGGEAALFDDVLVRAGLLEVLAARQMLRAESRAGAERASAFLELGRLCAGPLASGERAIDAWIDALAADAGCDEARDALRGHATATRDQAPLIEGLLRADAAASGSISARVACSRELAAIAEDVLADPSLSLFALERLVALGGADEAIVAAARARLGPRVRLQDDALAQAEATLARATADGDAGARVEALRRKVALLRGRPRDAVRFLETLGELAVALPEERAWRVTFDRVASRLGDAESTARALRERLDGRVTRADAAQARLALSTMERRRGARAAALREAEPLLAESASHRGAAAMVLVLAALEGAEAPRAEALAQLAAPCAPALRSALLAAASVAFASVGEGARARAAAEQACHADPASPRAVGTLADALVDANDRAAAAALERAAAVLVLSSPLAERLASTLETLGELPLAIAWTQRWLALRPSDPRATRALLRRAAAGEMARLADAVSWVLTLPVPLVDVSESISQALAALSARDAVAAAAIARRAADVVGVRDDRVRAAILAAAEAAGDPGLEALVLERRVPSSPDRGAAQLDVAAARRKQGETFAEARALARAARDGAPPEAVLAALPPVDGAGSDGRVAIAEARSECLAALGESRAADASQAFRDVGALRWDLAADPSGAIRAWTRAADLGGEQGAACLVSDLFAFAGPERAVSELIGFADRQSSKVEAANVLVLSATAALASGRPASAFDAASRAVSLDPTRTDALSLAERSAEGSGAPARLATIYDTVAAAALGSYGRRAAHYRGARQLERRNIGREAARHAIAAFEEVPTAGVTFVLMARLSDRAAMHADAIAAITRVADRLKSPDERATWLRRAADLVAEGEEGLRQRLDVLLRALNVRPDRQTVVDVAAALAGLVRGYGEDPGAAEMRFGRAATAALKRLDGPEGARIALAFAEAALSIFRASDLANRALARALSSDADLDEYAALVPHAVLLSAPPNGDEPDFLTKCLQILAKPYANVGPATLRLAGAVAHARGETRRAAELLVAAARRAPEDAALVDEAERRVAELGDEALRTQLFDALPVARRGEALRFLADEREKAGDLPGAMEVLERAVAAAEGDDRKALRHRLKDLYVQSGRRDAVEALLQRELGRSDAPVGERVEIARELASLVAARGDTARALTLLDDACNEGEPPPSLLAEAIDVARQAGDDRRLVTYLERSLPSLSDPDARAAALRELARAHEATGDLAAASSRWVEVGAHGDDRREALAERERIATARGDHEALAAVLAERAVLGGSRDEVRLIRLRRAAILEQRLGRLEDARGELEQLLESGDDPSATRFLADLHERLGAPLRAAPVWMRAFAADPDPRDKADHAARATAAYVAGGDLDSAQRALEQALALGPSERLLELKVEIARARGTARGLADALDELALASMAPAERRAELLVESAQAALAAGDDGAALDRAVRAARIAPQMVPAQLLARQLEYRRRGSGTPQDAAQTVDDLARIAGRLRPAEAPLGTFLLAEALDALHGNNAGMRELSARHAELGAAPLIALGMAERLARTSSFAAALPLFDAALGGDLQGMRRRGSVALAAADAAFRLDELDRALRYLEQAGADPSTAAAADQRRVAIEQALAARAGSPVADERRTLLGLAERAVGLDRARALQQLARLMAQNPGERTDADRVFSEALAAAELDRTLQVEIERERDALRGVPRASTAPPPMPAAPEMAPPAPEPAPVASPPASERPVPAPRIRSDRPTAPRDRTTIIAIRDAALRDHDFVWARALDHALTAFAPGPEAVSAPPLSLQRDHPDLVHAMLSRGDGTEALEALGLVWEAASRLFRREAGAYGVTGLDRVSLGAMTPASRVYTSAARVLGATRTPMFQRRSSGQVTVTVALLSPPAVVLAGDPRDETPELLYRVGFALAAASPERALAFGLPEAQLATLLTAIELAFGKSTSEQRPAPSVATLAESLWQALPARAQRRIGELAANRGDFEVQTVARAARRAARRAGLFVSGSLGTAVRELALADGLGLSVPLESPDGLDAAARAHPEIADLVQLATSREFADARWHGHDPRGRRSSGALRRGG